MEQPPTYACGSSPWRDYKYNKSTSNAEEEKEILVQIRIFKARVKNQRQLLNINSSKSVP